MSDNRRRYRAIRQALKQCYLGEPKGNQARHLNTLAGFISGIVGSVRPPSNVSLPVVCSTGIRLRLGRRGRSSGRIWSLRSCIRRWLICKQPVNSLWWGMIRTLSNRFLRKIRRLTMPGIMNVDVVGVHRPKCVGSPCHRSRPPDAWDRRRR